MKLKGLWIPTLLLMLAGGGAKLCDTLFNVYGSGFVLDSTICNAVFAGSIVLLLLIAWGLNIADRKKVFTVGPKKNVACGIFGFIASVCIVSVGVISLINTPADTIWSVVNCAVSLLGGGILLFESCMSFTGQNGLKKLPVLTLALPLWCCMRFLRMFSEYSARAVKTTEMFDIVALAFMLMILFYQSMYFAGINKRIAVRKTTVYGNIFAMIGLVVAADLFIKMAYYTGVVTNVDTQMVEPTIMNIITYAGDAALCLYALFFVNDIIRLADSTIVSIDEGEDLVYLFEKIAEDTGEDKEETADAPETDEPAADTETEETAEDTGVVTVDISTAVTTELTPEEQPSLQAVPADVPEPETPAEPEAPKPRVVRVASHSLDELLQMLEDVKANNGSSSAGSDDSNNDNEG